MTLARALATLGSRPPILVLCITLAPILAACDPPSTAPTIAITCLDGASKPLFTNGRQTAPIAVGDRIFCKVELTNVPEDTVMSSVDDNGDALLDSEDRPISPQYEWAFTSSDGGRMHAGGTKLITQWFRTIWLEKTRTLLEGACKGGRRNASPAAHPTDCNVRCCDVRIGGCEADGGNPAACELMSIGECRSQGGTSESALSTCTDWRLRVACCELPYRYGWNVHPYGIFPGFADGSRQLTRAGLCVEAGGIVSNVNECVCCTDDAEGYGANGFGTSLAFCESDPGAYDFIVTDPEICWRSFGLCGADDKTCVTGFCDSGGQSTLRREDQCVDDGGRFRGATYGGQEVGCCQDNDTHEHFAVAVPSDPGGQKVDAYTDDSFVAEADGTVTIRLRQLASSPLAFAEVRPGSSLVTLRIGTPPGCDDHNDCTFDICQPDGTVTHLPWLNEAICCAPSGAALTPVSDGDECTTDVCDALSGSVSHRAVVCPAPTEVCTTIQCQRDIGCTSMAVVCDDGRECTSDRCAPELGGGCSFVFNNEPCSDGLACTDNDRYDHCECTGTPLSCIDDRNVCTSDTCDAGVCAHDPAYDHDSFAAASQTFAYAASDGTSRYEASDAATATRLTIELVASAPGEFPIGASAADLDTATCTTCVLIRSGCNGAGCAKTFLATGGVVTMTALDPATGLFVGTLSDAIFEEVAIDPATFGSTPVADGETVVPPELGAGRVGVVRGGDLRGRWQSLHERRLRPGERRVRRARRQWDAVCRR